MVSLAQSTGKKPRLRFRERLHSSNIVVFLKGPFPHVLVRLLDMYAHNSKYKSIRVNRD